MQGIRQELKRLYDLPQDTGIFLTPSGTDAQFIPILVTKALNEGRDNFLNIVTGKGEIGSAPLLAAAGKYFSKEEPNPGYCSTLGFGCFKGTPINGIHNGGLKLLALQSRDENGKIVDHSNDIEEALQKCKDESTIPILHSVYGSSTGIKKGFQYQFKQRVEELGGVMVANAVQGRLEKWWLNDLLSQDAIVMTSGSRFYRGPPHTGAVFVSPKLMKRIKDVDSEEIQREWDNKLIAGGLNSFFGKNEFPRTLKTWRDNIRDNQNPGLALRWVAALAEMEPTLAIPTDEWQRGKSWWRA